ncbi:MAG: PAS domain S-box protein [Verrucomicrobiota bacterium]
MVGKTVGELSPFRDIESNQVMLERLQTEGHVRYENLPLETRDGRQIAVEFVSNVYPGRATSKVIQCNIRDITEAQTNRGSAPCHVQGNHRIEGCPRRARDRGRHGSAG